MNDNTLIQVKKETAKALKQIKAYERETYETTIQSLLRQKIKKDKKHQK